MAYASATAVIATPIGPVRIEGRDDVILSVRIGGGDPPEHPAAALLNEACAQITAYFAGELARFDLPLLPSATQRGSVLRTAICDIGFGRTRSYGDVAELAGTSARAIGQACARNPYPIIVPCHRVLAAGGRLGPYSAGQGSMTKHFLLKHEGAEGWLI